VFGSSKEFSAPLGPIERLLVSIDASESSEAPDAQTAREGEGKRVRHRTLVNRNEELDPASWRKPSGHSVLCLRASCIRRWRAAAHRRIVPHVIHRQFRTAAPEQNRLRRP
jgi:hypothetical protein